MSLADAIRMARARADGWIAVAAGMGSEEESQYGVALLSSGRVRELSVDAKSGQIALVKERPVREGHEEFAARLEWEVPTAKLDLARAVELALAGSPGTRAVGVEVVPSGKRLEYEVTLVSEGEVRTVSIDLASGEVDR